MDTSPIKRNWPSLNWIMREKVSRQAAGERNGRMPSITSIKASAGNQMSPRLTSASQVGLPLDSSGYLPPPRGDFIYRKNSEFGCSTITSLLLEKLCL